MRTQFFERSEGRLAFSDSGGAGELVIMLPGIGALRSEYRYLAPRLAEAGYRCITVDLRGQGESSVPWPVYDVPSVGNDILALIEHLGAGAAHVIGNSFSAAAAVWAAVERPDLVRSLVLITPFVTETKVNPLMKAMFWLMVNNPWRVRTWLMYYNTLYPTRKPADFAEYLSQLQESMSRRERFDAATALAFSSRKPSATRLAQVMVPTLVVMGSKDPDFPDPAAEGRIVAVLTGGRLEVITGAGHYPQTEMPEITAPLVIDFLKLREAPPGMEEVSLPAELRQEAA